MAVTLTNSFEGITPSGTALTGGSGGNTGGTSGSFLDSVTIGTSATLASDSTHAVHGGLGLQVATSATAAQSFAVWQASLTGSSISTVWFRCYLYLTALPSSGSWRVFSALSSGTLAAAVQIQSSTGLIRVINSASGTITTSTTAAPTNAWFRIEGFITGNATTGQTELKIFTTPDSATATETNTSAATQATTGAINQVRFGQSAAAQASYGPIWFDDLGASDTAYLGPSFGLRGAKGFNTGASAATTLGVTFPSTLQVGDLMLIWPGNGGSSATTWSCSAPVSGAAFSTVTAASGTGGQAQLLYKTATSQDVANAVASTAYTVTSSLNRLTSAIAAAYAATGFDPVPTSSGQVNASSATLSTPGITTNNNGDILVWFGLAQAVSGASPPTITQPSGFTARTTQSDATTSNTGTGTNSSMLMADFTQATAGATGAENGSLSTAHISVGLLIAVTSGAAGSGGGGGGGGGMLVGAYVTATPTAGTWQSSDAVAITTWQNDTGRNLTVFRNYQGTPPTGALPSQITNALNAGQKLIVSCKPIVNPATLTSANNLSPLSSTATSQSTLDANMNTFLTNLTTAVNNAGLNTSYVVIPLWVEPFTNNQVGAAGKSTNADFVDMFRHYYPIINGYGFQVAWCTSAGNGLIQNSELGTYPGDAYCDVVATDFYTGAYHSGSRISGYDPSNNGGPSGTGGTAGNNKYNPAYFADNASPPKPFAVYETGGTLALNNGITVTNFVHYLRDAFLNRVSLGLPNGDITWFNSGNDANNTPITSADSTTHSFFSDGDTGQTEIRNALFANLFDTLNGPAGGGSSGSGMLLVM